MQSGIKKNSLECALEMYNVIKRQKFLSVLENFRINLHLLICLNGEDFMNLLMTYSCSQFGLVLFMWRDAVDSLLMKFPEELIDL